ncbi:MAG: CDP-alcohol phosphatidyltransferase family protein [Parasporobacterium sp.]|nr:CDP-alcohol phosphatidyltransferase family protein [Parasporobacterium sp.]
MFFRKSDLHINKSDFFLLPNILTYIRFILVPVFAYVYLNAESLSAHMASAIIILVSGATDVADGFIARHWNLVSDLGKIIDPIADKAMQFTMMFCVCVRYRWVILLIIIYAVKEVVSALVSAYLFTRGKHLSGAMWCGKLCTVILFIVMLSLVAIPRIPAHVVATMIGFAAAFMLLAFVIYMRAYFVLWLEYLNEQNTPLATDMTPLDKTSEEISELKKNIFTQKSENGPSE